MIELMVSVAAGGAITLLVAHIYYKRAGDELRVEAADLRKLISMLLTSMERQGVVKLNRDESGNITGFIYDYTGSGRLKFGGSAKVEFTKAKPSTSSGENDTMGSK
jgi:hypothetical protein